MKIYSFILF